MSPRLCALPGTVLALVLLSIATLLGGSASAASSDPVGVWPLVPQPEVVAGFDPPTDPWGRGHRGVDLLGSPGQPVRAALPGRISWAGVLAGRGVVVVDHGTTRTTYEPVDSPLAVGTVVAAGDRIGRLSASGSHCPPRACLHWGWIEGETYLDPLRLVGAGPVRLLPLWRDEPAGAAVIPPLWRAPALPYAGWIAPVDLLFGLGLGSRPGDAPAGRPAGAGRW